MLLIPQPDTKGLVTIELLKGQPPAGMIWCETIASRFSYSEETRSSMKLTCIGNLENYGTYTWITGTWLEDSSTMPAGHKYGLKIIDDDTGDYNFSPPFDLIVPYSTYQSTYTDEDYKGDDDSEILYTEDDYGSGEKGDGSENYPSSQSPSQSTSQPTGQPTGHSTDPDEFYPEGGPQKEPTIRFGEGSTHGSPPAGDSFSNGPDIKSSTKTTSTSKTKKGLSAAARVGIAIAVVGILVIIGAVSGFFLLRKHKKRQAQKQKFRIGYEGVGGFIAEGRASKIYGSTPQMAQYRGGVETTYDPPLGQGLPVVGSTPSDTKYDPPSARNSVDTRYDPPSQRVES